MSRWLFVLAVGAASALGISGGSAQAWHGFHRHGWGGYGMGGYGFGGWCGPSFSYHASYSRGFWPLRSYYSYSSFYSAPYYPTYTSYYGYCAPTYYYAPVVVRPTYFAPVYYTPTLPWCASYGTSTVAPFAARSTTAPHLFATTASQTWSDRLTPARQATSAAVPLDLRRATALVPRTRAVVDRGRPAQAAPQVAYRSDTHSSQSWLTTATLLIDEMVARNRSDEALRACEQLMRVRDDLPSGIYARAALLGAAAGRDASQLAAWIDRAGDMKAIAAALPGKSVRSYLKPTESARLDTGLNRLAAAALQNATATAELKVLAGLLAADGQSQRAALFLAASNREPIDSAEPTRLAAR